MFASKLVAVRLFVALALALLFGSVSSTALGNDPVSGQQMDDELRQPTFQMGFLPYTPCGERNTIISVTNLGSSGATLQIVIYDSSSHMQYVSTHTIPQGGTKVADVCAQAPAGATYAAVFASDQSVTAVARVAGSASGGGAAPVAIYRARNTQSSRLRFAPFYGGRDNIESAIAVQNEDNADVNVALTLVNFQGNVLGTAAIDGLAPGTAVLVPFTAFSQRMPAEDTIGWVFAEATHVGAATPANIGAVLVHEQLNDGFVIDDNQSDATAMTFPVARVFGPGVQPSHLFVANTGVTASMVIAQILGDDGTPLAAQNLSLAAGQVQELNMATTQGLFPVNSAMIASSGPVHVWELAPFTPPVTVATNDGYAGIVVDTNRWVLPHVVNKVGDRYSLISIQNLGAAAAAVTLTYRDLAGATVATFATTVPAGGARHINTTQHDQSLPDGFAGSAWLEADQPLAVYLDEVRGCPAPVAAPRHQDRRRDRQCQRRSA